MKWEWPQGSDGATYIVIPRSKEVLVQRKVSDLGDALKTDGHHVTLTKEEIHGRELQIYQAHTFYLSCTSLHSEHIPSVTSKILTSTCSP